jgi:hypothetical protein
MSSAILVFVSFAKPTIVLVAATTRANVTSQVPAEFRSNAGASDFGEILPPARVQLTYDQAPSGRQQRPAEARWRMTGRETRFDRRKYRFTIGPCLNSEKVGLARRLTIEATIQL